MHAKLMFSSFSSCETKFKIINAKMIIVIHARTYTHHLSTFLISQRRGISFHTIVAFISFISQANLVELLIQLELAQISFLFTGRK